MWTVLAALQMEYGAIRGEELEPLMAGLAAGDQEALGQLYHRTRTAVYGLALSILRHGHDAEDVTQDTFVRAWEKAEQYRPQGTPMAWLLAIARNLALMKLRERARTQDLPPEDWESFAIDSHDVTTEDRMDKVSTMGYGMGYIGGSTIPLLAFLILNLVLGSDKMLFCLSFAFGLTAVWWLVFSIPLLKNVEQKSYNEKTKGAVGHALRGLAGTVKEIFHHKAMFVYLIAYFFYIDGVNTIIHMSTSYGDTLGLDSTSMLLALLLVQVLGLPFCLLYIKASEKFGARAMVGVGICIYVGVTIFGFFLREVWQFWVMAIMVATSQGGIQALSRSMFGKMIPDKKRSGEFFGF